MKVGIIHLMLPLMAAGALHNHVKLHKRSALANRAVEVNVITVTEIVTVAMDVEAITKATTAPTSTVTVMLTPSSSSLVAVLTPVSSSRPPTDLSQPAPSVSTIQATPPKKGGDNIGDSFKTLDTVANSAIIKNSCAYSVYVWSDANPLCEGPASKGKLLEANGTHTEPIRRCSDGGIAFKLSKDQTGLKPMQFEYGIDKKTEKTVYYDISYLDCMNNKNNEKDLSQCVGHDGGIQAVAGADCKHFQCPAGQWCDVSAYVVPEFGYKDGAPVGGCDIDKGIAFELCAGGH